MVQSDANSDERFRELIGTRPTKPRDTGKTMVIGDGLYNLGGMNYLEDLVSFCGQWVDSYKLQRGALALQSPDLLQAKLDFLDDHDILVFPGGNFLEAAVHEGIEHEFLDAVADVGCPGVEVSSTSIELSLDRKTALVERATDLGLHVHFEVGKKSTETGGDSLSKAEMDAELDAAIDAGAATVILEMEQIDAVRSSTDGDRSLRDIVTNYVDEYGQDRLLFELPLASYYDVMESAWWFIDTLGPDVNLGNASPEHVLPIEQQRRGLGQYAFREHYGGD